MDMGDIAVYFTAQLREGFNRSDAIRGLRDSFSLDFERAKQLIQSAPKSIKQQVDQAQANKVVKALWRSGWHSELHRAGECFYTTVDTEVTTAVRDHSEEVSAAPSEPRSERVIRVAADDQSCSVCVPDGWQVMSQLNPNACLQMGCESSDSYLVVIPQVKAEINRPVTLAEYAEAVLDSAKSWVEGGQQLQPLTRLESDISAVQGEIQGVAGNHQVCYLIAVYEGRDAFYASYMWSSQALFERQRPMFQALLSSFRIH